MSLRILTADDIRNSLPMADAIKAMKMAFMQLSNGNTVMPLRTVMPIAAHQAAALSMPAYLPNLDQLGVKIVTSYPNNTKQGLATIHGLVVLLNASTGKPEALLNGSYLTALRTGAASGLATDLLANPDAHTLAMIGAGNQARSQIEAVCCVRNIKDLWIYSRSFQHAEKLANELASQASLTCNINIATTINEATRDADIICTATPSTAPIVSSQNVNPGAHINAIGSHAKSMRELTDELIAKSIIVVDQRQAALSEAGELISCIDKAHMTEDQLVELGDVIQNQSLGRRNQQQITLFKSVGLAIQDVAAAHQAYLTAVANNHGTIIQL